MPHCGCWVISGLLFCCVNRLASSFATVTGLRTTADPQFVRSRTELSAFPRVSSIFPGFEASFYIGFLIPWRTRNYENGDEMERERESGLTLSVRGGGVCCLFSILKQLLISRCRSLILWILPIRARRLPNYKWQIIPADFSLYESR